MRTYSLLLTRGQARVFKTCFEDFMGEDLRADGSKDGATLVRDREDLIGSNVVEYETSLQE